MDKCCEFCPNSEMLQSESSLLIPHPMCYFCKINHIDIKEVKFCSSRPAEFVKVIKTCNSEVCKLYIKVSSEAGVLKLSGPKTFENINEDSECNAEKALKDVGGDIFPNAKTLSSLADEDPHDDLPMEKASANPKEDFGLQISDHSKDLVTLIAEAMNDAPVSLLEGQSNIELEMVENPRETAIESNSEEPVFEKERLNFTSKNIKQLAEKSRDAVASSDIEQLQEASKDFDITHTDHKSKEKEKSFKEEGINERIVETTKRFTLDDCETNRSKEFEKLSKLNVPSTCVTDSSQDEKKIPIPEPLGNEEIMSEDESSSVDKNYPQFGGDKENIDLNRVANNPGYLWKVASLETPLKYCFNELNRKNITIARKISTLKSELENIRQIIPEEIKENKLKGVIRCIQSYILEAESLFGIGFIENVTISLENFVDEGFYLTEIYKKLENLKNMYAVHHIEGKQIFGRVSLMDGKILVHSLITESINKDCETVWFKDIKKCFKYEKDELFMIYYTPSEGFTMEFIKPTENPLSQQFIKICTGECGPTYKDASLNNPRYVKGSRVIYTEIDVFEYMLNGRRSKGSIEYYVGEDWVSCLSKERVVIGSKDGTFKVARVDLDQKLTSVVGKVRCKKRIWNDNSYVYVRATTEKKSSREFVKECGLALSLFEGIRF